MKQPRGLGSLLEAIRVGEEQSLAVFATRMGIARGNLCDIEKERRKVSLDRAAAWVKLLGYARSRSHRAASRRTPHPPSRSGYRKCAHLQGLIAYRGLSLVSQVAKYYHPEMAQPVELSDDLVLDARLTGETSERSISEQVEHWARLGRAVDAVLRSGEVLALKRRGDVRPLSAALNAVETAEGRERLRAHLAERPYPHFEVSPDQPGLLVKIDQDGTRTVGRFVNRVFMPAEG